MLDPLHSLNNLFNHPGLRRVFLALRKPAGLVAGVALLWQIQPAWFWPGLAVSAVGAALQWWCFSCIMTQKELAANGPYTLVRNPMYLSRYILVLGLLMWFGQWWLLALYTVLYGFYMVNRVKREERKLSEVFGAPYAEYCRTVNRFLPMYRRQPGTRLVFARWDCFQRNNGLVNAAAVILFYLIAFGCMQIKLRS